MYDFNMNDVTPEMRAMLAKAGNKNPDLALPAQREFVKALQEPLREGLFSGDIVTDIYPQIKFEPGVPTEFQLDPIVPGTQKDFYAYTVTKHGYIPQRQVEGDYVMIPTYDVANSIDWPLRFSEYARWDVVGRCMRIFEAGFVKKANDDGWHTLLAAALDRNIVVYDSDASSGQFTKRVISLAKVVMRRNGGGNSATPNRGRLTDLYVSPEGVEDMRNWGVDIVDEFTRREIFVADDGSFMRIFNVNIHDIDELGEGQEYQNFFVQTLGGTIQSNDLELGLGLDLFHNDSFVSPTFFPGIQMFEDFALHRQQRHGVYGWKNTGYGVLDNRRVILISF
jgi:hypothetical protein